MENAFYVYLWVHKSCGTKIKIETPLVSLELDKLPIYVGRGSSDRKDQHTNNKKQPHLSSLIQKGEAECIILKDNLTWSESVYLETYLIGLIGTVKLGTGPLYNLSAGVNLPTKVPVVTKNNIELNTLGLLLRSLNENRTIESSARDLGISSRSLYRYMNAYKIVRNKDEIKNRNYITIEYDLDPVDDDRFISHNVDSEWRRDDERGGWKMSFVLPGVEKDDVEVTSGPGWSKVRHPNGSLRISLPKDVDHEGLTAKLDLGIFELFAPDMKAGGTRTIKVQ